MGELAAMVPVLITHGVELLFAAALITIGAAGARSSQLGGWTTLIVAGGIKAAMAVVGSLSMYLIFHRGGASYSSMSSKMMLWNGFQSVLGFAFYATLVAALVSLQRSLGAAVQPATNRPSDSSSLSRPY